MATKKITKTIARKGRIKITQIIEEEVKTSNLVNHIIFLLDDSGSMSNCFGEAIRQLNALFATVREQAHITGQHTTVSLYSFGGMRTVTRRLFQVPAETLQDVKASDFNLGPSTPLADAVCGAIADALTSPGAGLPNVSFLLKCLTDGGENGSTSFNKEKMPGLIQQVQATDRWTLAFMVPYGKKRETMSHGVPEGNIVEWNNDTAGARQVFTASAASIGGFYGLRSNGQTSTKKYFAETDLSKLTKTEINAKLDNLSDRFKAATVDKEVDIKAFAEEKTGKTYVIGSVYYALTKKEKVQAGKEVLIAEKNTKNVYGGAQARGLIGIPVGVEAIVTPGNHSAYDVYVKSTSVNRKLVRGTKILIDKNKTVSDSETWDSAAAIAAAELKKAQAEAQAKIDLAIQNGLNFSSSST